MAKKETAQTQEQEQQQVNETPAAAETQQEQAAAAGGSPAAEAPAATVSGGSPAGSEYPKTLTAKTREDLFQQVEQLKATLTEGQTLSCGAVGYDYDKALYTIQVDII